MLAAGSAKHVIEQYFHVGRTIESFTRDARRNDGDRVLWRVTKPNLRSAGSVLEIYPPR